MGPEKEKNTKEVKHLLITPPKYALRWGITYVCILIVLSLFLIRNFEYPDYVSFQIFGIKNGISDLKIQKLILIGDSTEFNKVYNGSEVLLRFENSLNGEQNDLSGIINDIKAEKRWLIADISFKDNVPESLVNDSIIYGNCKIQIGKTKFIYKVYQSLFKSW